MELHCRLSDDPTASTPNPNPHPACPSPAIIGVGDGVGVSASSTTTATSAARGPLREVPGAEEDGGQEDGMDDDDEEEERGFGGVGVGVGVGVGLGLEDQQHHSRSVWGVVGLAGEARRGDGTGKAAMQVRHLLFLKGGHLLSLKVTSHTYADP